MGAKSSIEVIGAAFGELFCAGNAAGMAELYIEDAALLPPGSPRLEGRDAIREYWQGMMDAGIAELSLTTLEVEEAGDTAIEVGAVKATAPGEGGARDPVAGKYIVAWKRGGDDTWRLHRDIWNFDA